MIQVTPAAAEQIRKSAHESQAEGMPLRIAINQGDDKKLHYAMGFDDVGSREDDTRYTSYGIEIVVSSASIALSKNMTIDYVEIEEGGGHQFIFLNPNDPNYKPPKD